MRLSSDNTRSSSGFVMGFGTARFFLAFCVAASHLWVGMTQGYAAYAVWAFFVLSGFLMTYIVKEKYGFSTGGLRAYAFNRFMRIFPLYWMAALAGLLTLWYYNGIGVNLGVLNGEFQKPRTIESWLHVITLLPIFQRGGLPVPVSNALAIEVGFYVLMPMLATSRGAAIFGAVFGLLLNLKLGIVGETFPERYATFLPCLLPFAVGSLVCHFRDSLARFSMPKLSSLIWIAHGLLWYFVPNWPWTWGLYFSLILTAWCVVSLYKQQVGGFDKTLGDMSYPMYLIHTTVGAWFLCACGVNRDLRFFALSFVSTIIISWLVVKFVDRPLSRMKWKPPAKAVRSSDI